jgi:hypothetical protein
MGPIPNDLNGECQAKYYNGIVFFWNAGFAREVSRRLTKFRRVRLRV